MRSTPQRMEGRPDMRLSLKTLLLLRQAALALVAAIESAALEGYGWTPRRRAAVQTIDDYATLEA